VPLSRACARLLALPVSLALAAGFAGAAAAAPGVDAAQPLALHVLSTRADLVSDGQALVEVVPPAGADVHGLRADVDGRDVSDLLVRRENGRVMGRVDGLAVGRNTLTVRVPSTGAASRIVLTNAPVGGPLFSGPQLQPWLCETEQNGLGPALDEQCNAPTTYTFSYKPKGSSSLRPYDPDNPPSDVDTTTTDQGNTVPFVVRTEKGTVNRGIYAFAVLYDPAQPWEPWAPQQGWNGKVEWKMGASSGTHHRQAAPPAVDDVFVLRRGFGVGTTSLNVNGNNSNQVVSAETMLMAKEKIQEAYGPIRFTMGVGCSGGSIQQHRIANSYPDLLQGLQVSCSYPDTWTVRMEVYDCILLNRYFNTVSPQLWPAINQRAEATGYQTSTSCAAWEALFGVNGDPKEGCQLPEEQEYDPQTNPGGTRCTSSDYEKNLWGLRPESVWTDIEKSLGRGFAKVITNNHGVTYGRNAVQEGTITPEQFVDLNEKIGTLDLDYNRVQGRTDADPGAVEIAYRTGLVNDFSQVDRVAIIDLRGTSNNEIHTDFHSHEMRERMVAANGHADNQVIWKFPTSIVTPSKIREQAFLAMDEWLTSIEGDTSGARLEEKVVANKPAAAVDKCYVDAGNVATSDPTVCGTAYQYFGAPRIAAGGPLTHDIVRCETAPLPEQPPTDGSFGPLPFTTGQWDRLKASFPDGICDWSKRPAAQTTSIPWLTYAAGPGGQPLGDPPAFQVLSTGRPLTPGAAAAPGAAAPGAAASGAGAGGTTAAAATNAAPAGRLAATGSSTPVAALALLVPLLALGARRRVS
jgi:hypothetical protein